MALDFTGIVKRRVQFVPYVQHTESIEVTRHLASVAVGHKADTPVSAVSSPGHTGHTGTYVTLDDMREASSCYNQRIIADGHTGHTGQTITDEDVEFFDERAGVLEFEGQLCRADAEAQAFSEWRTWLNERVLH